MSGVRGATRRRLALAATLGGLLTVAPARAADVDDGDETSPAEASAAAGEDIAAERDAAAKARADREGQEWHEQ
jgi:hypothetical protein